MNGDKNKKTYFVLRITLCNFVYHKQKNADMNTVNPLAAIKSGWQCTKNNFIVSLGLVMAYWVFSGLLSLIPLNGVMGTIASLISMFVSLMWSLGIVRLTIDVVDGEEPRFGVFGETMPRLLQYLILAIIMSVIMLIPAGIILVVGAVTCGVSLTTLAAYDMTAISALSLWILLACVPVIYLSIRFYFAPYLLVDRGVGPVEALKMSWKASYAVQGRIFLFVLLALLIMIIGLMCFIVGVLVSMIITMYAQAALYRQVFSAGIQDPLLVEDANVVVG